MMNTINGSIFRKLFSNSPQLASFTLLAMFLGGPKVRKDLSEMTTELSKVSSRIEFRKWLVRSHHRTINQTTMNWKPISMFPEEAKRFK